MKVVAAGPATRSNTLRRFALNGPTMGTRWSAVFFAAPEIDPGDITTKVQAALDRVDGQMSPWKPESVLSVFNRAPAGTWIDLPDESFAVVTAALEINALTAGAFDPFVGEPVMAFGFGADGPEPDPLRITQLSKVWAGRARAIGFDRIQHRISRKGAVLLDLGGIAKGYGVDRMSEVLTGLGISRHLASIDGEVRAEGMMAAEQGWRVGIERPDEKARDTLVGIEIADMALATSGTYRHAHVVDGRTLSHTIDPGTGRPVENDLLSVSVLADTSMIADALATALMVMGRQKGLAFAKQHGLPALLVAKGPDGEQTLFPTDRFVEITGLTKPV